MANQYTSNIKIADLTLEVNPNQYSQTFIKFGSFKRSIGGGIVDVDINGKKLSISVDGLTQSQIEDIKKRAALGKIIDFVDYIPIAEKGSVTREIFEDLGSEEIDSELIFLYIPVYKILITDFIQTYSNNIVEYKIVGEEA